MIRINLYDSKRRPVVDAESGEVVDSASVPIEFQNLRLAIVKVILACIPALGLYFYETVNIPEKQAAISQAKKMKADLEAYNSKFSVIVANIKKYESEQKVIEGKIKLVEKLSRERMNDLIALDTLHQVIPEKVWTTRLSSSGGLLRISGYAMSDFDISKFVDGLSKSAFLREVTLLNSRDESIKDITVKRFEISSKLERRE